MREDVPGSPNIRHDGHGRGTSEEKKGMDEGEVFIWLVRRQPDLEGRSSTCG